MSSLYDFSASHGDAKPSATVIVLRDGDSGPEVLLLQRNPELRAMGGAWVFPGGKVDDSDPGDSAEAQARHAGVRELAEEAGLHIAAEALEDFSHWLTPIVVKHRYATWFYITVVPGDAEITVDGSEIVAHRWVRPVDAIDAQSQGELTLPPPTLVSLIDISRCETGDAAVAMAASRQPPYFFPIIIRGDDEMCMLYPGDAGYEDADPSVEGVRHRTETRNGRFHYTREIDWLPRQV